MLYVNVMFYAYSSVLRYTEYFGESNLRCKICLIFPARQNTINCVFWQTRENSYHMTVWAAAQLLVLLLVTCNAGSEALIKQETRWAGLSSLHSCTQRAVPLICQLRYFVNITQNIKLFGGIYVVLW